MAILRPRPRSGYSPRPQHLLLLLLAFLAVAWPSLRGLNLSHPNTGAPALPGAVDPAVRARVQESLGKLPVAFTANGGQFDPAIRFAIEASDKSVFFAEGGITFVLNSASTAAPGAVGPLAPRERWVVKLDFVGANPGVLPVGEAATGGVVSYFKGQQADWKTGIPQYGKVVYHDLWPGIDLVYSGTYQRLKYEFVVRPGADPSAIQMRYRGGNVALTERGTLALTTPVGGFEDDIPVSFQDGSAIATTFRIIEATAAATTFGFALGAYDAARTLIIDPAVFIYASFLGGSAQDFANGIAVDADKSMYITGWTKSAENTAPAPFPVLVGPDTTHNSSLNPFGSSDAFIVKLNAAGTALVYSGFIGGGNEDSGQGIAVDANKNAYVVGWTESGASFPTAVGPDTTSNGFREGFIVKVNATGNGLVYAGYIAGGGTEALAVALDADHNAYVGGTTGSEPASFGDGFLTLPGPDKVNPRTSEGFIVKVKADGTGFLYATFVGGTRDETGSGIAVDSQRRAILVGTTRVDGNLSGGDVFAGYGSPATWQATRPGGQLDFYVVRLNAGGTAFDYAGYIGGANAEFGGAVAVDGQDNAYVTGRTVSDQASFPTGTGFAGLPGLPGAVKTHNGGFDAFIVKINNTGTALVYATYIGGSGYDGGSAITVDAASNAYVFGRTSSPPNSFPNGNGFVASGITGPDTTYPGGHFVAEINAAGTAFVFATYIVGNYDGGGIAVDGDGAVYAAGAIESGGTSFPGGPGTISGLPGYDQTFAGSVNFLSDAYIVKIGAGAPVADPCPGTNPIPLISGANGHVFCGQNNPLLSVRAPGVVPDSVTAVFWWSNGDQAFKFWFKGFPNSFQTLTTLEAGKYYFFQTATPGPTIANAGGTAPLAAAGTTSFGPTNPGAYGQIWAGTPHLVGTLEPYASINGVSAIFGWDNPGQLFKFWFRGFPIGFQTLTGIDRGKYYFFQTPGAVTVPMN